MEGFFCGFPNFFAECKDSADRKGYKTPQNTQKISRQVSGLQNPAAAQEKIERRSGGDGQNHVNAHLSALNGDGMVKEESSDRHPKHEIKQPAQQPEGNAYPQYPEAVVEQSHHTP